MQQFARAKEATSWRVAVKYRTSKTYFRGISNSCTVSWSALKHSLEEFSISHSPSLQTQNFRFRIHIRIKTGQHPERDFEYNFAVPIGNYSCMYMMLMEAMQKYKETDTVTQILLDEFAVACRILYFNVFEIFTASLRFPSGYREISWWYCLQRTGDIRSIYDAQRA